MEGWMDGWIVSYPWPPPYSDTLKINRYICFFLFYWPQNSPSFFLLSSSHHHTRLNPKYSRLQHIDLLISINIYTRIHFSFFLNVPEVNANLRHIHIISLLILTRHNDIDHVFALGQLDLPNGLNQLTHPLSHSIRVAWKDVAVQQCGSGTNGSGDDPFFL
mmetsp:Transcript_10949/g.19921  ORF Transcript_10949/g.19921 Transcript_10949/m.19921 type:complete len:161 (-) Transcript_10949:1665-2147(-)